MSRSSRRRSARWVLGSLAVVAVLATAGVAAAHEVGGSRFDAPVPPWMLYGGSALTVAVTAAWLGYADDSRRLGTRTLVTVPEGVATPLRRIARAGFLLAVTAAVAHGIVGKRAPAENLATVFVWAVWIKGVGLWSLLAGSPWRHLSPWEAVYDGLVRLEGDRVAVLGDYPERLGRWPALVGFATLVGVVENLTVIPRDPRLTVLVVATYALAMVLGGIAFGREWFRRADALAVLYRLFGCVAPVAFVPVSGDDDSSRPGYRATLRAPWRDCTDALSDDSLVVFALAAVYTVSFDGFSDLGAYQALLDGVREGLGTATGGAAVAVYLLGLAVTVGTFSLAGKAADRLGGRDAVEVAGGRDASTLPDGGGRPLDLPDAALGFGATVLPIAGAYEVAHNYPFVVRNLGQSATVLGDLVLGTGPDVALLSWLPLPAFWVSQVALIVAGHVVAVVAAHRVAVRRYGTGRRARRGHLPMVVVMVAYTVISLWIVSQPVLR